MVPSPATVSDIFNDSNHKLKTNSRTTKQIEPTGRLTQTPNSQLSILTNSRGIALSLRSVLDTSDYGKPLNRSSTTAKTQSIRTDNPNYNDF